MMLNSKRSQPVDAATKFWFPLVLQMQWLFVKPKQGWNTFTFRWAKIMANPKRLKNLHTHTHTHVYLLTQIFGYEGGSSEIYILPRIAALWASNLLAAAQIETKTMHPKSLPQLWYPMKWQCLVFVISAQIGCGQLLPQHHSQNPQDSSHEFGQPHMLLLLHTFPVLEGCCLLNAMKNRHKTFWNITA